MYKGIKIKMGLLRFVRVKFHNSGKNSVNAFSFINKFMVIVVLKAQGILPKFSVS